MCVSSHYGQFQGKFCLGKFILQKNSPRPPPRPTWISHLMVLLSWIIKKFLSRSLNASLDCALNARKAVIGDYEQQKPILSSSLTSPPYNCYFFSIYTLSCHWNDFLTKREYIFRHWQNCPASQLG